MSTSLEHSQLVPPKVKRTPLPKLQLAILCFVRLAEPVAYTQIFPYINQMMEDLKVTEDRSKVGFYSGVVDSVFALAQLCTVYRWGRLSDRIGRKPVVLMGLAGVALGSLCFGLSNSLFTAILTRSMAGALSGNVAVVQSVLAELTDSTNQAQIFPLAGLIWSLGCVLGPLIGGTFSNPATRYPDTFGHIQFLHTHPYFLPCFISASLTILSICTGALFLEETLPSKIQAQKVLTESTSPSPTSYGTIQSELPSPATELPPAKPISAYTILSQRKAQWVFSTGFLLSGQAISFDAVFILFAYTALDLGGLQRTSAEIGYALSFAGMLQALLQTVVFHRVQRRFNTTPMYRTLMSVWPISFALLPALGYMARHHIVRWVGVGVSVGEPVDRAVLGWPFWVLMAFVLAIERIGCMSFGLHLMMVKSVAPNKAAVGATFGLAQTIAASGRAIGPAFVSSLFALSIDKHLLGGNLVWVVMMTIGLGGAYVASQLEEPKDDLPPTKT